MPTTESSGAAFWLIPDNSKECEKPANQPDSSTISVTQLKDDIKVLETGFFADCTVVCGDQTWATHKVILSRCPYFALAFSSKSGFKEAVESRITIENFEPFEVSWLLQYIYGLRIDVENARKASPSKSFLETCALLYSIGDYFRIQDLSWSVYAQLQIRCKRLLLQTRCASRMLRKIEFLPDLEAGIRAAWRHDRVASPVRLDLTSLCVGIHPFVKNHDSFLSLLGEVPEFTVWYMKALLGCPGMQMVESHVTLETICYICDKPIFDSGGALVSSAAFVWTPTSFAFWDNWPAWFCSRVCYNSGVSKRFGVDGSALSS